MAIMDVVEMTLMFDSRVSAVRSMDVRVGRVRQMRLPGVCRGLLGVPCGHRSIVTRVGRGGRSLPDDQGTLRGGPYGHRISQVAR